jgi:hypothetical protein
VLLGCLVASCTTDATLAPATQETSLSAGAQETSGAPAGSSPHAAAGDEWRFSLGLRTAFVAPERQGQLAFAVDAGARNDRVYVGAYGSYGLSFEREGTGTGTLTRFRGGVNAHYHLHPSASFDPWVGAGLGGASLKENVALELNVQVGVDLKPTPSFRVGPFVAPSMWLGPLGFGGGPSSSPPVPAVTLGVRVAFDP